MHVCFKSMKLALHMHRESTLEQTCSASKSLHAKYESSRGVRSEMWDENGIVCHRFLIKR